MKFLDFKFSMMRQKKKEQTVSVGLLGSSSTTNSFFFFLPFCDLLHSLMNLPFLIIIFSIDRVCLFAWKKELSLSPSLLDCGS
jgi:hypothetical protein